jgi:hypothetical protein
LYMHLVMRLSLIKYIPKPWGLVLEGKQARNRVIHKVK